MNLNDILNSIDSDDCIDCILDYEDYANFIMNNCGGDRIIRNGDDLVAAMEDSYLEDEFRNANAAA